MGPSNILALHLHEGSHCHGGGREDEADTDPLEVGDARDVACDFSSKGDGKSVIEWNDDDEKTDRDDG